MLAEIYEDYAINIYNSVEALEVVNNYLAQLSDDPGLWLEVVEFLSLAADQGEALALSNNLVYQNRGSWTGYEFNPISAFELGHILASSLIICRIPDNYQTALKLPLIDLERIQQLYTPDIQTWISKVIEIKTDSVRVNSQQPESLPEPEQTIPNDISNQPGVVNTRSIRNPDDRQRTRP